MIHTDAPKPKHTRTFTQLSTYRKGDHRRTKCVHIKERNHKIALLGFVARHTWLAVPLPALADQSSPNGFHLNPNLLLGLTTKGLTQRNKEKKDRMREKNKSERGVRLQKNRKGREGKGRKRKRGIKAGTEVERRGETEKEGW